MLPNNDYIVNKMIFRCSNFASCKEILINMYIYSNPLT